ncbi:TPA: hypothetical protein ACGO1T_000527 [Streptococcus suis]
MQNLSQFASALYHNKAMNYNGVSGQDAMRKLFYEKMGVPVGTKGRELYTAFQTHKYEMYALIAQVVDGVLPGVIKSDYLPLANIEVSAHGDKPVFTVRNKELFQVAVIASGTKDLRRQTRVDSQFTIDTDWIGVAVYAEFEQFLIGMTDFAGLVDAAIESLEVYIGERVIEAIVNSYDSVRTKLKHTGSGSFDIEQLVTLARHVKAQSRSTRISVYGTASALGQLAGASLDKSDRMKDELAELGYLKTIRGLDFYVLPDVYKFGTEEFAVNDKTLLIVPGDDKIVNIALEGDALAIEGESKDNNGLQLDFVIQKKVGVQVNKAKVYGFYKLS